ncbi:MAG: hypothetical protein Q8P10_00385 [bacterium]|nr:hypothetical protein [bacterium]
MKNKNLIIIAVVLIVLIGTGFYFFLSKQSSPKEQTTQAQDEVIPTIAPSDLGLTTEIRDDSKAIKFEIANAKDIESIDYQISYTKEVNGEQLPEGLIGTAKPEGGKIAIKYREFGTCSSGKCRYDTVVSAIKLTLKITKTDGKVYQSEISVEIPGFTPSASKSSGTPGGDY